MTTALSRSLREEKVKTQLKERNRIYGNERYKMAYGRVANQHLDQ